MYDFLKEFESPEGHWNDFDILKPIVIHLYNTYTSDSSSAVKISLTESNSDWYSSICVFI